jgi:hypothetical protein
MGSTGLNHQHYSNPDCTYNQSRTAVIRVHTFLQMVVRKK